MGVVILNNKEILEDYKQAYEELKLILDLSFDQITIADGNGVFTKVSKSCEPCFGVPEKDLIGGNAFDLEKAGVYDISVTAEVIRQGKKVTLIQKTAANKILMVTGIPLYDEEGNITKIINISKDITENEILSNQLYELKNQLQWFQKELNVRRGLYNSKITHKSPKMDKIMDLIYHISDSDVTVLLLGETGVGKGHLAKMIHESSSRKDEPFVTINCGAIPENLLESELFGYEGGAFTGASKTGKKGLFEIAGEGTIFLDEIGDMPMSLQVKLLHVLDGKKLFRVGGEKPIPVKGRIIAATNKNLLDTVNKGEFRRDLYYRLNVVPITIPPLKDRREDILGLIKTFLDNFNKEHKTNKIISKDGYEELLNYDYPGNIRELENIIERLIITTLEEIIEEKHIIEIIGHSTKPFFHGGEIIPIKEAVRELERNILIEAFKRVNATDRKSVV